MSSCSEDTEGVEAIGTEIAGNYRGGILASEEQPRSLGGDNVRLSSLSGKVGAGTSPGCCCTCA